MNFRKTMTLWPARKALTPAQERTVMSENNKENPPLYVMPKKDEASDSFDLDKLKLQQNFGESLGVKKALLTIPVRKPGKQEFVRVHPSESMRMLAAVIELKDAGNETYLVTPEIAEQLP